MRVIITVFFLLIQAGVAQADSCPESILRTATIYQDANYWGPCRYLEIGLYRDPASFAPVRNDSVSSLRVSSNVRMVLYEHDRLRGGQVYFEPGIYPDFRLFKFGDRASSIEVFRAEGGRAATYYLGNHPYARENFFSEDTQGIAHDATHWFITTTKVLYKVPLTYDLKSAGMGPNGRTATIPLGLGYDHLGDPDVHNGIVYVPIEKKAGGVPPRIAMFDAVDLRFRGSAIIRDAEAHNAGWVAVMPGTGTVWTSHKDIGLYHREIGFTPDPFSRARSIKEYRIPDSCKAGGECEVSSIRRIILKDRAGQAIDIQSMQGGVFNPEGTLLYQVNGYCNPIGGDGAAVRVFHMPSGVLQARSSNGFGVFNFENHQGVSDVFCAGEEPEGIDYLDVAGRDIPGIPYGRLHVLLMSNEADQNDVYLKHYDFGPPR